MKTGELYIYLAGKIGHNDWRHTVVKGLRGHIDGVCGELEIPRSWRSMQYAIFGKYHYNGPFFVGCDHGCFHGPNTHGVKPHWGTDDLTQDYIYKAERKLVGLCKSAISRSSLVFAWLDDPTAYGTLVELGYASAKERMIVVAGPKYIQDLWLAYTVSTSGLTFVGEEWNNPETALRGAIDFALGRYDMYASNKKEEDPGW